MWGTIESSHELLIANDAFTRKSSVWLLLFFKYIPGFCAHESSAIAIPTAKTIHSAIHMADMLNQGNSLLNFKELSFEWSKKWVFRGGTAFNDASTKPNLYLIVQGQVSPPLMMSGLWDSMIRSQYRCLNLAKFAGQTPSCVYTVLDAPFSPNFRHTSAQPREGMHSLESMA